MEEELGGDEAELGVRTETDRQTCWSFWLFLGSFRHLCAPFSAHVLINIHHALKTVMNILYTQAHTPHLTSHTAAHYITVPLVCRHTHTADIHNKYMLIIRSVVRR